MKVLITITPEEIASSMTLHNNSEEFGRIVFGYGTWKHIMSNRKKLAYALGRDISISETITNTATGLELDIMVVINKRDGIKVAFDTDLIKLHDVLLELYKRPVEVKAKIEEMSEHIVNSKKNRRLVKGLRKSLKRFLSLKS